MVERVNARKTGSRFMIDSVQGQKSKKAVKVYTLHNAIHLRVFLCLFNSSPSRPARSICIIRNLYHVVMSRFLWFTKENLLPKTLENKKSKLMKDKQKARF